MFNPMDWLSWLYGRYFTNHPVIGYLVVISITSLIASLIWTKAIDNYRSQHPASPVDVPEPQMTEGSHPSDCVTRSIERVDVKTKGGREKVVKQLNAFIEQGRLIESQLVEPTLLDSVADARVSHWNVDVGKFTDQHMGTKFAGRFRSDKDLPTESPLAPPNSAVKKQLWQALSRRILRLNEFINDLNSTK